MGEEKSKAIIGTSFIVIGIIIIVIGIYFLIANLNFVNKGIAVKGTISEEYVKFDVNGKEVKVTSGYIEFMTRLAKNSDINMVYNPEDPQNAKLDSFTSLWIIPGFVILIGLIIIFMGVYIIVKNENTKD